MARSLLLLGPPRVNQLPRSLGRRRAPLLGPMAEADAPAPAAAAEDAPATPAAPPVTSTPVPPPAPAPPTEEQIAEDRRSKVLAEYRKTLLQHKEIDAKVRSLRDEAKTLKKDYDKTEYDLNALQSVGQIIGEVLRQLDDERFIVKASSGPRYVVGCRSKLDKEKLTQGTRVTLDMTTLTIMRALPREVDPVVFHMKGEEAGAKKLTEEV